MKKKYIKPQIIIENFSLSTTIAGDCESIVSNPSKGTCAIVGSGGMTIFDGGVANNACKFTPEGMGSPKDEWDGFCYHVPTEYNNLFNS